MTWFLDLTGVSGLSDILSNFKSSAFNSWCIRATDRKSGDVVDFISVSLKEQWKRQVILMQGPNRFMWQYNGVAVGDSHCGNMETQQASSSALCVWSNSSVPSCSHLSWWQKAAVPPWDAALWLWQMFHCARMLPFISDTSNQLNDWTTGLQLTAQRNMYVY